MCHHDTSAATTADRLVDFDFRDGVQRTGRLVKNQKRRAVGQCAGDLQTLALPAGKIASPFRHIQVQHGTTGGQLLFDGRVADRLLQFPRLIRRGKKRQILPDRSGKKHDALIDGAHRGVIFRTGIFIHGFSIQKNLPRPRKQRPVGKLGNRRLSGTRSADQSDTFSGRHFQ